MEVKDLYPFALTLILVAMLVGVGLILFDNFGDEVKDATGLNETLEIIGNAGTSAQDEVTAVARLGNTTVNYTQVTNYNWTEDTGVFVTSGIPNGNYSLDYVYDADSTATTALGSMTTATSAISNTWLTLIVTVVVLAIILGIVIQSFANRR